MRRWLAFLVSLGLLVALVIPAASANSVYRFTVVFHSETLPSHAAAMVESAGGTVLDSFAELGVMMVQGPASLMKSLSSQREVLAASPTLEFRINPAKVADAEVESVNMAAADLYNAFQWDIKQVTNNGASYQLGTGSHQTVVGIIDTGINTQHNDLKANLLGGRNYVPDGPGGTVNPADIEDKHGHGSHVAGSIAGNGRILGVAPDMGYRAYRIFGASGGSPSTRVMRAMIDATNDGVDVISMSLGGYDILGWGYWTDPSTGTVYRFKDVADFVAYRRAVQYAVKNGVVVVAAAGNEATNVANPHNVVQYLNAEYGPYGYYFQGAAKESPGTIAGVVAVSATGPDYSPASYTNYGPGAIDLSAPGGDFQRWPEVAPIPWWYDMNFSAYRATALGPNRYAWSAGTSMATPKVSAVAALIIDQARANGERITPSQVVARMQQTAQDKGKNGYDAWYGHGFVNAYEALK